MSQVGAHQCRAAGWWQLAGAVPAFGLAFCLALSGVQAGATESVAAKKPSTADHTKFKELAGPFGSGEEVTKACLSCHTEASKQLMATRHWTWEYTNPDTGQKLGKKTMLNGFCIGDKSNEPFCNSCHIGYGWKDASFDFNDENKVDCLVCHNSGDYVKPAGLAGNVPAVKTEWPIGSGKFFGPIDLAKVSQHVGKTRTDNCGTCHYNGGGGDGVKHGDLDSSLNSADKDLDVHMAAKDKGGQGFTCSTCHQSDGHVISGSRIQVTASDPHGPNVRGDKDARATSTCQSCHGDKPHKQHALNMEVLNSHSDKLACQACHVPEFARGGVPTKMTWDWSKAGLKDANGKPYVTKDEHGHPIYDSRKGTFGLGHDVVPEYVWFNGKVTYTLQTDTIDPSGVVKINTFHGGPEDPKARIWPVKRFQGKQPYDTEYNKLLVPHTATPDDTAYWFNFDWPKALKAGAEATGHPYSGKFGFINTEMLWPITHMVAPKDKAVPCIECHTKDGRMGKLTGIYLPGRDSSPWIDWIGWLAVAGTIAGTLLHAGFRIFTKPNSGKHHD